MVRPKVLWAVMRLVLSAGLIVVLSGCGGRTHLDVDAAPVPLDSSLDSSLLDAMPRDSTLDSDGQPDGGRCVLGQSRGAVLRARGFDGSVELVAAVGSHDRSTYVVGQLGSRTTFDRELSGVGTDDAFVAKFSPEGAPVWSFRLGGDGTPDRVLASSAASVPAGGVTVAMGYTGTLHLRGATGPDATLSNPTQQLELVVARYDDAGALAWHLSFGLTPWIPAPLHVASSPDGDLVVVASISGATPYQDKKFVARFAADGRELFRTEFEGFVTTPHAIAVDAAGNIVLGGEFGGTMTFGGDRDASALTLSATHGSLFLVKLDPVGNALWGRQFAYDLGLPMHLAVDPDGSFVVAGSFAGRLSFGTTDDTRLVSTPNVEAGAAQYDGDVYVAKLSQSGTLLFAERFGDRENQGVDGVAIDGDHDIVLTGIFEGVLDLTNGSGPALETSSRMLYGAKLDATGRHVWSRALADAYASTTPILDDCNAPTIAAQLMGNTSISLSDNRGKVALSGMLMAKLAP
jgi:hypothetical protein